MKPKESKHYAQIYKKGAWGRKGSSKDPGIRQTDQKMEPKDPKMSPRRTKMEPLIS